MPIDTDEIFDKSLEILNDALEGKFVQPERFDAAVRIMQNVMFLIYNNRNTGQWSNTIDDKSKDK